MKNGVYKAKRFIARGTSCSILPDLKESIISFGFDDCPLSPLQTALPLLEAEGWRATIYIACGLCDTENHFDIEKNQDTLEGLGLPRSRHFAYPLGHVSPALKRAVSERFLTSRGVLSPTHPKQDSNLLKAARIYSGKSLQDALRQIELAKNTPIWLNFFTHDVRENPSQFGCTPSEFQTVVNAVKDSGLRVMTVDKAYRAIQNNEA